MGTKAPHRICPPITLVVKGIMIELTHGTISEELTSGLSMQISFCMVPKYRYRIFDKKLREELQEIIEQLCNWEGFVIIEDSIQPDHVHL